MAEEFKPSASSTLREYAEYYAKNHIAKGSSDPKRIKAQRSAFVSNAIRYFKDIADVPGSAISIYIPDENGVTPIAKNVWTDSRVGRCCKCKTTHDCFENNGA